MEGFLLIDKPDGLTSHDVVNRVRRLTGEKRVGHAGTLDPFATGLLIVGVGRMATREFPKLVGLDKEYEAVFALGGTSDTDDRTGRIEIRNSKFQGNHASNFEFQSSVLSAISSLTGPILQIPPAYSAIKIGGKKMYEAAREGKPLEAKPRAVTVYSFDILPSSLPSNFESQSSIFFLSVRISCSTGTYIRSLARDLGAALGTGGYVQELRRTSIGPFSIADASLLSDLSNLSDPKNFPLIPVQTFLSRLLPPATVRV